MSRQILVVDDERALREELADFFRSEGFSCAVASGGIEALALATERDFDVVLVDIRMPDMDGIALVQRLREQAPKRKFWSSRLIQALRQLFRHCAWAHRTM